MNLKALAEWIGFQIVWFACALGAARQTSTPGVIAAAIFIACIIALRRGSASAGVVIAASGLTGLIVESGLASAGLLRFAAPWPGSNLAPAWMLALWLAFGATLPMLATLLGQRSLWLTAGLGALAGPLAYVAGERLGALEFTGTWLAGVAAIALAWGIALPALVALQRRLP